MIIIRHDRRRICPRSDIMALIERRMLEDRNRHERQVQRLRLWCQVHAMERLAGNKPDRE